MLVSFFAGIVLFCLDSENLPEFFKMFCRQGFLFIVSSAQTSHPYNLFRAYFAHYPPSKHRFHACVGLQKPLENLFRFRLKRVISPRTPSDWKIQPKILSVDFFKSGWTNGRLEVAGIRIRDFREGSSLARTISGRNAAQCAFLPEPARGLFFMQCFPWNGFHLLQFRPFAEYFHPFTVFIVPIERQHEGVFASFSLEKKTCRRKWQNHKGWLFFSRLNCGHKKMHV